MGEVRGKNVESYEGAELNRYSPVNDLIKKKRKEKKIREIKKWFENMEGVVIILFYYMHLRGRLMIIMK